MVRITNYHPPFWAQNGFLNTLYGASAVEKPVPILGEVVRIPFSDEGYTTGIWYQGHLPWVLIGTHGLGGSLESDFCKRLPFVAHPFGPSVLVVNHRNAGTALGLSSTIYNSGKGEDYSDYIRFAKQKVPHARIVAFAYSLGGSMLLNLCTGRRGQVLPDFAVVMNPPLDLLDSSNRLSRGRALPFGQNFVSELRHSAEVLIDQGMISPDCRVPLFSTLRTVDEVLTAPLSGYKSALEYYKEASIGPHLGKIKVPTLIVAALDDPMINFSPLIKQRWPGHVQLHIEKYGGHLGFVLGSFSQLRQKSLDKWTTHLITDVVTQICQT